MDVMLPQQETNKKKDIYALSYMYIENYVDVCTCEGEG